MVAAPCCILANNADDWRGRPWGDDGVRKTVPIVFDTDPPIILRLLGVLHYSGTEGVRNSPRVQKLFWGKEDHGPAYMVTPTV